MIPWWYDSPSLFPLLLLTFLLNDPFCAFGRNTERYSICPYSVRMWENMDHKNPNKDTFHAALSSLFLNESQKFTVLCRRKQSRHLLKLTFRYSISKHYSFVWFYSHVTVIRFQHLFCYTAKVFDDSVRIISIK